MKLGWTKAYNRRDDFATARWHDGETIPVAPLAEASAARPQSHSGFKGIIQAPELLRLACRDEVELRRVMRIRRHWNVRKGPFTRTDLARLPARGWSALVQAWLKPVRCCSASHSSLARLDDIVVSHAAPGRGVGPRLDSYERCFANRYISGM
jgi:ribosomal protein L16 Arg81 hydroxylase